MRLIPFLWFIWLLEIEKGRKRKPRFKLPLLIRTVIHERPSSHWYFSLVMLIDWKKERHRHIFPGNWVRELEWIAQATKDRASRFSHCNCRKNSATALVDWWDFCPEASLNSFYVNNVTSFNSGDSFILSWSLFLAALLICLEVRILRP